METLRHPAWPVRVVLCPGDNLGVARYCAGNGLLTERPHPRHPRRETLPGCLWGPPDGADRGAAQ
eukprot:2844704-Lingulodinium_polyedra.AAC.1